MNFHGTEKKLRKGSHDLWERNQNVVYHKIWNPRAGKCLQKMTQIHKILVIIKGKEVRVRLMQGVVGEDD